MARRTNSSAAGQWDALFLDVERPAFPALRVEVTGHGSLVLRQGDTVVLMAQIDANRYGVEYVLTDHYRSPIPPVRAAQAATLGSDGASGVRRARWAYRIAAALTDTVGGPLHTGRWAISPEATHLRPGDRAATPAERWAQLLLPQTQGSIDWFIDNGAWQILPLHALADPDAGRVKSYRKQVREGVLAPILLWWISGLDCYVILDGHDRLVAALTEKVEPPVLALSSVSTDQLARDTENASSSFTTSAKAIESHAAAGTPGAAEALVALNRGLADNLRQIETSYGATRAWPVRGGTAGWNALANTHAPAWYREVVAGSQ